MTVQVRDLGCMEYQAACLAMNAYTDTRGPETPDALWLLSHPPTYTLGLAGRHEHLLATGTVPVVQSDRGGQVTYHGPGQLVAYLLLDLRRRALTIRALVSLIEDAVIATLTRQDIRAERRAGAPGVYVGAAKIAALGLRVRRGCTYHGLAVNVDMDPEPWSRIDPCGYPGLAVTDCRRQGWLTDVAGVAAALAPELLQRLDEPVGDGS